MIYVLYSQISLHKNSTWVIQSYMIKANIAFFTSEKKAFKN